MGSRGKNMHQWSIDISIGMIISSQKVPIHSDTNFWGKYTCKTHWHFFVMTKKTIWMDYEWFGNEQINQSTTKFNEWRITPAIKLVKSLQYLHACPFSRHFQFKLADSTKQHSKLTNLNWKWNQWCDRSWTKWLEWMVWCLNIYGSIKWIVDFLENNLSSSPPPVLTKPRHIHSFHIQHILL